MLVQIYLIYIFLSHVRPMLRRQRVRCAQEIIFWANFLALPGEPTHRHWTAYPWIGGHIRTFKIFFQNYDSYNCMFGNKLKDLSLSFILGVMQWNCNVLIICFSQKTLFLPKKNAFLKLENIHNFDNCFHPLRNIVRKRNCLKINVKQKHVKFRHNRISMIDVQEVTFLYAAIVTFLEGQNVTSLTVTILTMIFHSPFPKI